MRIISILLLFLIASSPLISQQDFEVFEASITEIQAALDAGEVTSVDLVEKYLARIAAYDKAGPNLNSIVRINPQALQNAAALDDERRRTGPRSLLHGIPVIVKDNYNTRDMPTTGGSVALAGFVPSASATQVEKLEEAGAIVLAKSTLHEFAYGITTISSLTGQTRNPYDLRRVPGGSSGGTAAAIAASLGAVGMGSDTCGSIRIPSAFNNLVGLRPSKGLSSIYGIIPLSHTQDVAGPLARTASDLAIVLDAVSGFDPRDAATSIIQGADPVNFFDQLDSMPLQGLRIGRLESYFDRADGAVVGVIEDTFELLEQAGVEIVEIEIPGLAEVLSGSGLIGYEFKNDLNAYLREFSTSGQLDLATIVEQGLYHRAVAGALTASDRRPFNAEAYDAAFQQRQQVRLAIEGVLDELQLDAIAYPPISEVQVFTGESQPGNNCSISANSGLPAISIPAGFTSAGLPVGLELLGSFLSDTNLVAIAYQIESLADNRRPPSTTPPLEDNRAPIPAGASIVFAQSQVSFEASLSFDRTTNVLRYELRNSSTELANLYAVTLVIESDPGDGVRDPVVHNLIGPGVELIEGELFASPDLRQAIDSNNVYLRIFGVGLAARGVTEAILFAQ